MTRRFSLIAEALTRLRSRSCIIDGEAVACDDNGLASFERIRYRQHDGDVLSWPRPALASGSTSISKAASRRHVYRGEYD
jgi:hypothetical protein